LSLDFSSTFGELHHRLVEHYAPPSLLVNAELEIVHSSEHAHRYLVSNETALLTAIHPALRLDAIAAVYEARAARLRTASRIVRYREASRVRTVGVRARVVDHPGAVGMMLILFDEIPAELVEDDGGDTDIDRMRAQLASAAHYYECSLEELTASNEELRIANEELRLTEARLRVTEQRFQLAMRAAPLFAMHQDARLHYTWRYMFGRELAPEEYPALFDADVDALRRDVMASRSGRRTELVLDIDGTLREFDVFVDPIVDGDYVVGVTTVGFDVSIARAAEALLRDADRKKDEFLATLSHELRNPLTPLRVALDLQRAVTEPDQLEFTLQVMDRQLTQLTHLVDELLDISRITTGRIQLVPSSFPTRDAVDAAVEATRPLFDAGEHRLDIKLDDAPERLRADYARVTQILTNLLSNAAKYTPHGGHVELVIERADGHVRFTVRDDGIGIERASLSCVFDLFAVCRDDSGRSKPGLGVGLNLVKRLVELHGGTVEARSAGEGCGSEFVVELPIELR